MTETRKWSALTAVLVVAILAAGWFLLVSPKRGDAATLEQQANSQRDANSRLQEKLVMLKAQQKDLPQQQAALATLRTQIPDNPALPALVRDLTRAGLKAGVSIDAIAPAVPVAIVDPAAAVAPAAPAASDSTEGSSGDTAPPPAKPATASAVPAQTLFQLPVTLTVTGSYFELEHFLSKLENTRRSFLVSGFTLGEGTSADAVEGDLTILLKGRVFVTQKAPATPTAPVTADAPTGEQGATS